MDHKASDWQLMDHRLFRLVTKQTTIINKHSLWSVFFFTKKDQLSVYHTNCITAVSL